MWYSVQNFYKYGFFIMSNKYYFGLTAITLAVLSACSVTEYPQPTKVQQPVQTPVATQPTQPVQQQPQVTTPTYYASFDAWKSDFSQRLISSGYDASSVQRLLSMASYSSGIVSLDRKQPEFSKMPWSYADSAVSGGTVANGKKKFNEQYNVLNSAESRYGVPASIIAAIWGIESSYGAGTGNADLVSALATLAYDGRRRSFAESQLSSLLTLLQQGDVRWEHLKGSWAGGMGHTQFIPETWLKQGVDGDYDGRRNPWAAADALNSTANYLANSGWVRGLAPFYEVRLPTGFDYRLSGTKKTFAEWKNLGLNYVSGSASDMNAVAELWLPAGVNGPALLLSKNFEVIRVYNNSSSYALAVSMLAKELVGLPNIQTAWPRDEQPLSLAQGKMLQQRLTQAGYDTQGVDGVIGTNTRKAFQRWQADNGQLADGFISVRTASKLIY